MLPFTWLVARAAEHRDSSDSPIGIASTLACSNTLKSISSFASGVLQSRFLAGGRHCDLKMVGPSVLTFLQERMKAAGKMAIGKSDTRLLSKRAVAVM